MAKDFNGGTVNENYSKETCGENFLTLVLAKIFWNASKSTDNKSILYIDERGNSKPKSLCTTD